MLCDSVCVKQAVYSLDSICILELTIADYQYPTAQLY
jgi:hypothetical protein